MSFPTSAPAGFSLVTGTFTNSSGVPFAGTVEFTPVLFDGIPSSYSINGQYVSSDEVIRVTPDSSGSFAVVLADTSLTRPRNISFCVRAFNLEGKEVTNLAYKGIQPTGSTWNLSNSNPQLVPQAAILQGPAGTAGAPGAKGADGPTGPRGFSGAPISGTFISGTFPTTERNFFGVQNQLYWDKNNQTNQSYQQAAFFSQNDCYGYGWSWGSDWTISKSALLNYRSTIRGIHQGIFNSFEAYGEGDKAGIYSNMTYCCGPTAFNDEGVTGISSQVFESTYDFFGTISVTTGTGDQLPTLANSAGNYWPYDGGILLNMSKSSGIAGQLTGYSTPLENYLNYLPVTITAGGPGGGKLPTLKAWGVFTGFLGGNNYPAAHSTEVTVSIILKAIGDGSTPALVNGHARLGGQFGVEQVMLSNVQPPSNGSQTVTLSYRIPNGTFYLCQSDISDMYISFDARSNQAGAGNTPSGQSSAYPVLGSKNGNDLIYLLKHNGSTGWTVPFGDNNDVAAGYEWGGYRPDKDGNHPWAGFHLYVGAEVVGASNNSDDARRPALEPNRIAWAVGDTIQATHPPSGGGGYAHWFKHYPQTPVRPGFAHNNVRIDSGGMGVSSGYSFLTIINNSAPTGYFTNGGPLGKPVGIQVEAPGQENAFRVALLIKNAPDPIAVDSEAAAISIRQDNSYTNGREWVIIRLPHNDITYWQNNTTANPNGDLGGVDNQWYLRFSFLYADTLRAYNANFRTLSVKAYAAADNALWLQQGRLLIDAPTYVLVHDGQDYQLAQTDNVAIQTTAGTVTLHFVKGLYVGRS